MSEKSSPMQIEFKDADLDMVRRLSSLAQQPTPALIARVCAVPTPTQRLWQPLRRAWILVAVTLFLTVLVSVAPQLYAAVTSIQETIGNVHLSITDRSPDTSDCTIVEPELMSLQAAQTAIPFDFVVPARAPDGWVMVEQVHVNDLGGGPFIKAIWSNPGHANISFSAWSAFQDDGSPRGGTLVGTDSFEEIEVGGRPAVIVRGGWDHDTQEWAWPGVKTILWTMDGVRYELSTSGKEVSEADLVSMAESTSR